MRMRKTYPEYSFWIWTRASVLQRSGAEVECVYQDSVWLIVDESVSWAKGLEFESRWAWGGLPRLTAVLFRRRMPAAQCGTVRRETTGMPGKSTVECGESSDSPRCWRKPVAGKQNKNASPALRHPQERNINAIFFQITLGFAKGGLNSQIKSKKFLIMCPIYGWIMIASQIVSVTQLRKFVDYYVV